ncbi:outer membrane lipid asymmetry maintenance protein MlaD [Rhodobacter lacus]|uniref:Outer membrane lipid asymmetry maintenance protein MlaD n=1 Tax=Rhodobacter lacus TaxID=1641972 RepID=A0ABW5A7H2_9RHOB
MSENRVEVLTGAAVLAVAVGFFVWAGQGHGLSTGTASYPLKASFRSVEGVSLGTDVRMAGVKIGTVTEVALNPKTFFADTTVTVREGIEIPEDSQIIVASEGLLGGAFIEILPGGSLDNLAAGDEILDTQGAVSTLGLLMKFAGGGDSKPSSTSGSETGE